jgi:hypothetical protein
MAGPDGTKVERMSPADGMPPISRRMVTPRRRGAVRRAFVALAATLALLAAADTVLWRVAISWLEQDLAVWQAQRRAAGWTVTAGPPARGGWPWAARLDLPSLALTGGQADLPGGVAWRGERVGLGVALLRPRRLVVTVGGAQDLRLGGLPPLAVSADSFALEIPLEPGGPARSAELDAAGLRVRTPAGEATIARLAGHGETRAVAGPGEAPLSVVASADQIVLPDVLPNRAWALGPRIAAASLDAALTGRLAPGMGPAWSAAAWRDGGGTLEVRRFAVGWGPLGLTGSATLALDAQLQPMGDANVRIVGAAATLDALAAAHTVSPRAAQAAGGVLALLARVPEGGGPPQVQVPLTLRDRTLALGGFPLVRMPVWVWQGAR